MAEKIEEEKKSLEAEKQEAMNTVREEFQGRLDEAQQIFRDQADAARAWAEEQTRLQQDKSQLAVQELQTEKDQAGKDYTREQSAAFVDFIREKDDYGTRAESLAAVGMQGTGYSETSRMNVYNTYQLRLAAARDSYTQTVASYDRAIAQARAQNSAILAQIAYDGLKAQLQLSLDALDFRDELLDKQAQRLDGLRDHYDDLLAEAADRAEQIRQFNIRHFGNAEGVYRPAQTPREEPEAEPQEPAKQPLTGMYLGFLTPVLAWQKFLDK